MKAADLSHDEKPHGLSAIQPISNSEVPLPEVLGQRAESLCLRLPESQMGLNTPRPLY